MRIHADDGECELAHVGLGDNHGACRAQPPDYRRIRRGRRRIGQDARARPCWLVLHVEQVLDADDRAVEWTEQDAAFRPRIGRIGGGTRAVGIDREAGARALPGGIGNAGERLLQTFARAHETTGNVTISYPCAMRRLSTGSSSSMSKRAAGRMLPLAPIVPHITIVLATNGRP